MMVDLSWENQALLERAAATTSRSECDLANEAMHWYFSALAAGDEHSDTIARARLHVNEGRTIDHETLFAQIFQELGTK